MSHFTVLVIGDVDSQLEKFDESIEVDKYSEGLVEDKEKESFMNYYRKNHPRLGEATFEEMYEEFGEEWNGGQWEKNAEGQWESFSTYNPNSKWDWYEEGGRWSDFFMLKHDNPKFNALLESLGLSMGEVDNLVRLKEKSLAKFNSTVAKYVGKEENIKTLVSLANTLSQNKVKYADSASKKEIDFLGMQKAKREKALWRYDLLASCFPDKKIPKLEKTWKECVAECEDTDKARFEFHSQPAMEALNSAKQDNSLSEEQKQLVNSFYLDLEDYNCTREEYGQRGFDSALSTYAVVVNGEWYQKGDMGWFGMSSNDMPQHEWDAKVIELLAGVEDDETITLVDCHI